MLEGEITIYLDEQPGVRASAGSFAHIPGGHVHGFRIESDTARYLILTTSGFYQIPYKGAPPSRRGDG